MRGCCERGCYDRGVSSEGGYDRVCHEKRFTRYVMTMCICLPVVFQTALFGPLPLSVDWPPEVVVLTIRCRRTLIGF